MKPVTDRDVYHVVAVKGVHKNILTHDIYCNERIFLKTPATESLTRPQALAITMALNGLEHKRLQERSGG